MAIEKDSEEITRLKEVTLTNTIQADTIARLLIEKGIFSAEEYLEKMREVQTEYMKAAK